MTVVTTSLSRRSLLKAGARPAPPSVPSPVGAGPAVVRRCSGHPQALAARVVHRLRHQRRDAVGLGRPEALPDRAGAAVRPQPHGHADDRPRHLAAAGLRDGPRRAARRRRRAVAVVRRPAPAAGHPADGDRTSAPATAGRFFATQQGTPASRHRRGSSAPSEPSRGRASGCAEVLDRLGLAADAVSIQATGLDPHYVTGGVDYGRGASALPGQQGPRRRPARVGDERRAAAARPRLPDAAGAARLGRASRASSGSARSRSPTTELTSPWNTKWYRMTGGAYPADSPPLTVNPVRSAWELGWGQTVARRDRGRADRSLVERRRPRSTRVDVSVDGGATWQPGPASTASGHREAWTQWRYVWTQPARGAARADGPGHRRRGPHAAARRRRTTTTATSSTPW